MDLLCTEENSSELSTTNALRDKADSLHREPANAKPADDDIVMIKAPQEEPDTKPKEDVVMKTVRLDSDGNEEAHVPDDPKTIETKQPDLTSCQIYRQNESVDKVKQRAGRSTDHSTDREKPLAIC